MRRRPAIQNPPPGRILAAAFAGCLALLSACTRQAAAPSASASPQPPAASVTAPPTSTPTPQTVLASGEALPSGCDRATPSDGDTAVFVAEGRAWSLSPDGTILTCLFRVSDPGPFIWGPLGDRALLGGLQMEALGGTALRKPVDVQPGPVSWGHPEGKAVVFVSDDGTALEKRYLEQKQIDDISPLHGARYLNVLYHPSGLALAFVVDRNDQESIWLSSNLGEDPTRLVFSKEGTQFGALDFSADGRVLVYAAQHADNHPELHALDLTNPTEIPRIWKGERGRRVLSISEPPNLRGRFLGLTLGTSCDDSQAMLLESARDLNPVLPHEDQPTRVLGWLNKTQVLVAAGGCSERMDLTAFDVRADAVLPLVADVDAASVRTLAPTPTPELPKETEEEVGEGVG